MAKIKINWPFIIGFLILFIAANVGFLVYASSNSFCGKVCHSMNVFYSTWEVSSHGPKGGKEAVKCDECHYEKGIKGYVDGKITGVKSMIKEVTANYETPIKGEPKESRCIECHDPKKMNETETHKIPHELHAQMGLKCMSCHAGLVHGNEGEGEAKVTHEACKQCHDVENQDDCTKCHKW